MRSEPVVPNDCLLVERGSGSLRPDIAVVGYGLVAQRGNGDVVQRSADVWSSSVAVDSGYSRSCIRISAVRQVVAIREGRGRHYRRIHVLRLSRHERDLVAEL